MSRLIIASNNAHKLSEIEAVLQTKAIDLPVLGLKDLPQQPEVVEDGDSFLANARKKALTIASLYPTDYVLADDSGLVIPALNGEPGVYSARYAGDHDDAANNKKVLTKLQDVQGAQRAAYFTTVMVLVGPNRPELVTQGRVDGFITQHPHGQNGFGYDPIFWLADANATMAEISASQKNAISHRGRALAELVQALPAWLKE